MPGLAKMADAYHLSLDMHTYDIISWTADEVVARSQAVCRTTLLTLNVASGEVYQITRNNETERCREEAMSLPALDKPRISRLVDSFDTTRAFWEEREQETNEYKNSEFVARMKKLMEAAQSDQERSN